MIGHVFPPIPVRVQPQTPAAQNEDLPQVQAGATGGFLTREDFVFEPRKHPGLERGVPPKPLKTGEDGREFIAAPARQANLFDRDDREIGLGWEMRAQGGK